MRKSAVLLVASSAFVAILAACSSSSSSADKPKLPEISADKLGQGCSGFGTSPGDSASFKDGDCQGGYCLVDLTGNVDLANFPSYCSADCDVYSCPTGYICKEVTLGDTKHACFIDPNAPQPVDAGTCEEPSGKYRVTATSTTDSGFCPAIQPTSITIDTKDAGSGCTESWDPDACTLTQVCSTTDAQGFTTKATYVITSTAGESDATATLTVVFSGGGADPATCTYDATYTKQ